MLDQLERDRCQRAGIAYVENKPAVIAPAIKRPPLEEIAHGIKILGTYTEERNPGVQKTCLKTLIAYTSNVLKNLDDDKFKTINLANEAF